MGVYSIKDLEQLTGIKSHTIRIWEQRYGIIEPKRTDTNIRFYDDEQLKFLLNVALLSRHGYKISKISKLSEVAFKDEIEKLYEQTLIHNTDVILDLDANDLMVSMIDMDAEKFHRIYENSVKNNGFERTITHLIYPFLEKVGILWSIGQVNPSHEHFISCLIRQKVIAGIDRLPNPSTGKKFLLFLPQGEHHEIGLLMASFLLKKNGCIVYYMGQNLPDKDIESSIVTIHPDAVLTFFVDPAVLTQAAETVQTIIKWCGDCEILIATRPAPQLDEIKHKNLHFLHGIADLENYF
ncbi:MAG: MerR family transcriptional regulator [Flavobacteriales bacterium]|nr:MerR family transcriptional regulator [Flavobacteriales bacterium]